jgi:hypothetical protein
MLPETDTLVVDALAKVVCPVAERVEVYRLVAVNPVDDAVERTV